MKNTYTVTAGNAYFYQSLCVQAAHVDEAAALFQAYLDRPENKAAEQEEYDMGMEHYRDNRDDPHIEEGTEPTRDEYVYKFDEAQIEEEYSFPRWTGTPSSIVQCIASGGNG